MSLLDGQRVLSCGNDIKVLDLKTTTKVFAKDTGEEFRLGTSDLIYVFLYF